MKKYFNRHEVNGAVIVIVFSLALFTYSQLYLLFFALVAFNWKPDSPGLAKSKKTLPYWQSLQFLFLYPPLPD